MGLFFRIPIDKKSVESAITHLEQSTSAELRVFIERKIPQTEPMLTVSERAFQIFEQLEMTETAQRNGVLIYLAFKDHQCSVIGDEAIHQYVGEAFWQQVCDYMISYFRQERYTQGIVAAIEKIGTELIQYFPRQADDQNELPNEVIIHD